MLNYAAKLFCKVVFFGIFQLLEKMVLRQLTGKESEHYANVKQSDMLRCHMKNAVKNKVEIAAHTLRWIHIHEVWCLSEHDLLQDDSEAVDISFLSSIDRSSCHT